MSSVCPRCESMMLRAFATEPPDMSMSRSGPSGSVTPSRMAPSFTSTSSRLPPPRSPTMPSAVGMPEMRPRAANCASSLPARMLIGASSASSALRMKLGAVGCLAGGGRGYGKDLDDADLLAERAEPPQCRQRPLDGVCRQVAGQRHAAPEPAQDLFVDDRRRRAPQPVIDHQTHRIRPDIDDGHRPKPQRSGLQILDERHFRALTFFEMSPEISGGNRSLSELPRPESDGLFMKYSCALKGSSPG